VRSPTDLLTSAIEPSFDQKIVDGVGIDDMGKASSVKVSSTRIQNHIFKIDIGSNGSEFDVAKPSIQ
jgi:hypothetical protein